LISAVEQAALLVAGALVFVFSRLDLIGDRTIPVAVATGRDQVLPWMGPARLGGRMALGLQRAIHVGRAGASICFSLPRPEQTAISSGSEAGHDGGGLLSRSWSCCRWCGSSKAFLTGFDLAVPTRPWHQIAALNLPRELRVVPDNAVVFGRPRTGL